MCDREYELLLLQKKALLLKSLHLKEQRGQRKFWVRPLFLKRKEEGLYHTAVSLSCFGRNYCPHEHILFQMKTMRAGDPSYFIKFYRMTPMLFEALHEIVKGDLRREYVVREPLATEERLAVTIS